MKKIVPILLVLSGLIAASAPARDSRNPAMYIHVVAKRLDVVWSIVFPSRDIVLFTERPGRVRALVNDKLLREPLLTLPDIDATYKLGAMGLELHPQFSSNHWVYLAYSYKGSEGPKVRVVRYRFDEKTFRQSAAQALTDRTTIIENIPAFTNHAGCRLRFGPDKKLYISTGDANAPELAQKLDSLAGKMLRLNDDGSIPKDNPFVDRPDARPEIWSYGHRNSQGFDFQPGTNLLFASEHGPTDGDEINIIEKGKNYGWPIVHHEQFAGDMEPPLLLYGSPSIAPASGMFYRGKGFPQLRGDFLVGCLRGECILRVRLKGRKVISQERMFEPFEKSSRRIREVVEAPDGSIYFSTSMVESDGHPDLDDDKIIKLVPGPAIDI